MARWNLDLTNGQNVEMYMTPSVPCLPRENYFLLTRMCVAFNSMLVKQLSRIE